MHTYRNRMEKNRWQSQVEPGRAIFHKLVPLEGSYILRAGALL